MAKEICISSTPHETRLAILEDDQLAEIYYERENEYTLAGSIYNGRVTRVLPGMQSAFVDLGLERDAFLYVTDFVELEDQEDTDELEKAAVSGAERAPQEVKHPQGFDRNGQRQEDRGPRRGQRPVTGVRPEHRALEESAPEIETPSAPEGPAAPGRGEAAAESEEAGARRWRGRRRRRGGRGPGALQEPVRDLEPPTPAFTESSTDSAHEFSGQTPEIYEAPPAPRGHSDAKPFVLPGESLSKYGGTATPEAAKPAFETARRVSTSKPSTLIETPLSWDGSGLLPGESISRLRERQPEPEVESAEVTQERFADLPEHASLEEEAFEESEELIPPAIREIGEVLPREPDAEFEEESLAANSEDLFTEEEVRTQEAPESIAAGADTEELDSAIFSQEAGTGETAGSEIESETTEGESDASASHRVDPSSPTGFRLFGFGGKKKKEEEAGSATAAPHTPSYAPGAGHVEEEVIEGEEFEVPRAQRHKPDLHDLDDYEEQTLPSHMRTGDLGEMLQEAHLDHRIQMKLGDKNGEEDVEVEEEEPSTETHRAPSRDRRDRGGRGQRGRVTQGNRRGPSRRSAQTSDLPIISDLLKAGQEILVQIAKEPIAKKGARITSHIALPGRFLVFMPTVSHVGVSRKIASDDERHRLKRVLLNERGDSSGGFIVRTAAEGASEEELRADLRFLINLWAEIKQRSESSKSPALIYHDLSLIERILRDQVSANFASIWVDTQEDYERIVRFLNRFSPSLVRRVKLYTKETPLFEHFGIQDEISKALRSKVWLKSGGSIVINQTEALVAIDINTGKYVGKSARLEDTILKTNLDAVPEIVRQIRLRDLGGIIVIDFIDMDERKNRYKVMAALEEALKSDRAPTKVLQFNDFGLVAITRKRVKQSLERTLSVPCPTCQATGMVKSPTTVCNEIYIEMRKMRKHFENADVMLRVNPETVKILKSNGNRWLNEFEELVGKNILVKSDATLHPEQFDIQG